MARVSLAELCSAISLFTDLGTGQPAEHAIRTTLTAMRLADALDIEPEARGELYYTTLLRFFGCSADAAATAAAVGGDEAAFYAAMAPVAMGSNREQLHTLAKAVAPDASGTARGRRLLAVMTDRKGPERMLLPHCEVGARLAGRLNVPEGVAAALSAAYARWDGKGVPAGLAGEDIPQSLRIAIVAREIVLWCGGDDAGVADVADVLADRRGRALDPTVVDAAIADLPTLVIPSTGELWDEAVAAEPSPRRMLDDDALDDALAALADFADLKIAETSGHSRGVSALAADAAELWGAGREQADHVRRAGLVHDLGRVGVGNTIWSHPGTLSAAQWSRSGCTRTTASGSCLAQPASTLSPGWRDATMSEPTLRATTAAAATIWPPRRGSLPWPTPTRP